MKKATFTIPFKVPGLNGSDGLIRQHYHSAKKLKNRIYLEILSQKREVFSGKVSITYTRYSVVEPDIDNLCASFKHIGDSLVKAGIIKDDKPSIIADFIPRYGKAKNNAEQRATITITEIP